MSDRIEKIARKILSNEDDFNKKCGLVRKGFDEVLSRLKSLLRLQQRKICCGSNLQMRDTMK
jgi:hypothetical protein